MADIDKKKSSAKAAGLKSTFVLENNKLLMTSFGNGNKAVIEKIIDEKVGSINKPEVFSVTPCDKKFELQPAKRGLAADSLVDNPLKSKKTAGDDAIHCRKFLERQFFDGNTFNDNIHIQLIYNILDIEKILSVHVNDIVYSVNNILSRGEGMEYNDYIGTLNLKSFETYKNNLVNKKKFDLDRVKKIPQLAYFGSAFYNTPEDTSAKITKTKIKSDEEIYYTFMLLSTARNFSAHYLDRNRAKSSDAEDFDGTSVIMYNLDNEELYKKLYNEKVHMALTGMKKVLDANFNKKVEHLNNSFIKNSAKDFVILCEVLGIKSRDEKTKFVKDYYDFVVRKNYKHLGFSVKELRELLFANHDSNKYIKEFDKISNKKFDSVRSRLNRLADYIIYDYYNKNNAKVSDLVKYLRAAADDEQKKKIYLNESINLVKSGILERIKKILPKLNGKIIGNMQPDSTITASMLHNTGKDWHPISENAHYFTKWIYTLTLFMDGKEINDLVTTLINKFDNIASFIEVLKSQSVCTHFSEERKMFIDSAEICSELSAMNSFARMEAPGASSKRAMFVEAARILGDNRSKEELEEYFDTLFDKSASKKEKGFRNFIRNNVVDSNRFKYLTRYTDTSSVKAFSNNKALVKFAIKDIPQEQILRYYNSCFGASERYYNDGMSDKLVEAIGKINLMQFNGVIQQADRNMLPEEKKKANAQKEKYKSIIRLYLTVCYLFFKNLVYVNSRYYSAFYNLEKDRSLFEINGELKPTGKFDEGHYTGLVKLFIDNGWINPRASAYLTVNLANSDETAIRTFRNTAEHLEALRNVDKYLNDLKQFDSYFEIYHYITQRNIKEKCEMLKEQTVKYNNDLLKYHGYSKDFVKALCVPFGYNLPRFKNLSIDALFDKNDKREKLKKGFED